MKKIIALCIAFALCVIGWSEARNALLIANGKYKYFDSLSTPVKEARNLKATLEKIGFSVVILENASREEMIDELDSFQKKLEKEEGIGFFHYGGHAVQQNGHNYLIPVDVDIPNQIFVPTRSINVDEITLGMTADTNIIVLDACRNNPLPAGTRGMTRGLELVRNRPQNSIIIYSAQPDSVAEDGVFTPILTQKLLEKKSLNEILMEVRKEVREKTKGIQIPVEYSSLENVIFLANYEPPKPPVTTKITDDYNANAADSFKNIADMAKGDLTYSSAKDLPNAIIDSIEKITPKEDVEIVFAIDATGSMKDDMEILRNELIPRLQEELKKFSKARIGLLLYRDYGGDFSFKGIPVKMFPFTSDFALFEKNLNSFDIHGTEGGDIPEAVYEALYGSLDFYSWSNKTQKKIILIGDAPAHPSPRGNKKYNKNEVKALAEKKNITIDAIIVPDRKSDGGSWSDSVKKSLGISVRKVTPSISGRAVVAESSEFPKGLFCKTVGYMPGDSILVTNSVSGKKVTVLVLGSIDPSEGVAIRLSKEAADSLQIKKGSNIQVEITKVAE